MVRIKCFSYSIIGGPCFHVTLAGGDVFVIELSFLYHDGTLMKAYPVLSVLITANELFVLAV